MSTRRLSAAAFTAAAFLSSGLISHDALAQDVAAGRKKAIACQTCHGMDGIAKLPDAPHLAAQPAAYLERPFRCAAQ
ncbi:MAG: cytochrome c class [Burkholderiaceae bacterium]|nr:cytochrome c class [Burkholderiaceae bacterium]